MSSTSTSCLHPTLRTLLIGTYESSSSLHCLAGHSDVLRLIWTSVQHEWALSFTQRDCDCVAFAHVDNIEFPSFAARNVNMMPFLLDDLDSLPDDLRDSYGDLIETCRNTLPANASNERRVAYLTVQEGFVSRGESQRRPGLHTEGFSYLPCVESHHEILKQPYWHAWGFGMALCPGKFTGGIFMASDVDDSTLLYNVFVPEALVGAGGDVEHLRPVLNALMPEPPAPRSNTGKDCGRSSYAACGAAHLKDPFDQSALVCGPISVQAKQLFWMTDHTPHESRPLKEGQRRQFFRLVTGRVDAWFAAHSTPNPRGTLPDARIITHDKFTGKPLPTELIDGILTTAIGAATLRA